ncbi:uncharacterized protein LOC141912175 [Tubulanus polymorphus]|uniref:uncharacterized protein LOC141912175 n=1 Tax=Tubulanus polymorphus TaxID=672921 RepID=UPI003DA60247
MNNLPDCRMLASSLHHNNNNHLLMGNGSASSVALVFYDAIINNELDTLRKVVEIYKIDVNARFTEVRKPNHVDLCPVHLVAYKGYGSMLQYLIDYKCDVTTTTQNLKRQAIHYAAMGHQMGCLRKLLKAHAQMNSKDTFGNSPCHYAAEDGNCDIIRELLAQGAEVDSQDITWKTPLMKATRNGKARVSELLLKAGCDVNIRDEYLNTALHFAARCGSLEILNKLLKAGAKINVQNHWGLTPLMEAVCYNQKAVVGKLIDEKCDLYRRETKTGDTALHIAVKKNYCVISDMLLKAGEWIPYVYNYNRESLLHDAVIYNRLDIIRLFVYRNFDIEIPCKIYPDGRRKHIVQLSLEKGNIEICKIISDVTCSSCTSHDDVTQGRVLGSQSSMSDLTTVKSLRKWSRRAIRRSLGFDIEDKINNLPVPQAMKDYITCRDLNVHHCLL